MYNIHCIYCETAAYASEGRQGLRRESLGNSRLTTAITHITCIHIGTYGDGILFFFFYFRLMENQCRSSVNSAGGCSNINVAETGT